MYYHNNRTVFTLCESIIAVCKYIFPVDHNNFFLFFQETFSFPVIQNTSSKMSIRTCFQMFRKPRPSHWSQTSVKIPQRLPYCLPISHNRRPPGALQSIIKLPYKNMFVSIYEGKFQGSLSYTMSLFLQFRYTSLANLSLISTIFAMIYVIQNQLIYRFRPPS